MGLFEKLTNAVKKAPSGLYNTLTQEEAFIDNERRKAMANDAIIPMQIAEDGSIDKAKTLALKNAIKPLTFAERMLGRTLTEDTRVTNPETGETTMETVSNYRPGLLTDFSAGMNENYRENFAPENFANSESALGNKKGLAYRLGEGAGSLAKILAGVGGDAFTAGTQGLDAALRRQNYRTENQLYRNALERQGIETSNINGLINGDMFKNFSTINYKNRNLDQNSYIKMTKQLEQLHKTGQISNDAYMSALSNLNSQYVNSNTLNIDNVKDSNETYLTPFKAEAMKTNSIANKLRADAYAAFMAERTYNNEEKNGDLAEFLEIMNTNDRNKIEFARGAFTKKYGKDPYKLIEM